MLKAVSPFRKSLVKSSKVFGTRLDLIIPTNPLDLRPGNDDGNRFGIYIVLYSSKPVQLLPEQPLAQNQPT